MDALISIKPKFVDKIIAGEKTVEIRRRKVNITPGTKLWLYSTLPTGCIKAIAFVGQIETLSQSEIWKKYKDQTCISKEEYFQYTSGAMEVTAIVLHDVEEISPALSLSFLKSKVQGFSPPQFYKRIQSGHKLKNLLDDFAPLENKIQLAC